jgi:hypothetical protein
MKSTIPSISDCVSTDGTNATTHNSSCTSGWQQHLSKSSVDATVALTTPCPVVKYYPSSILYKVAM